MCVLSTSHRLRTINKNNIFSPGCYLTRDWFFFYYYSTKQEIEFYYIYNRKRGSVYISFGFVLCVRSSIDEGLSEITTVQQEQLQLQRTKKIRTNLLEDDNHVFDLQGALLEKSTAEGAL